MRRRSVLQADKRSTTGRTPNTSPSGRAKASGQVGARNRALAHAHVETSCAHQALTAVSRATIPDAVILKLTLILSPSLHCWHDFRRAPGVPLTPYRNDIVSGATPSWAKNAGAIAVLQQCLCTEPAKRALLLLTLLDKTALEIMRGRPWNETPGPQLRAHVCLLSTSMLR